MAAGRAQDSEKIFCKRLIRRKGMQYEIRPYRQEDRQAVRRISCETAFPDVSSPQIFTDDEILADALTVYFTDFEPESCFVAESAHKVVGYIIGARDVRMMRRPLFSIFFNLLKKAMRRKVIFDKVNQRFSFYFLKSLLKGEFFIPDFSRFFPSTLHINLDRNFRNGGIGKALIDRYVRYLRGFKTPGIQVSTFSVIGKGFFIKMGFRLLFSGSRSFLMPYTGKTPGYYLLGRKL
ncbi:MAG: hypothetical protein WC335_06825 [Candidatus Omnitrophota bacterium]